MKVPIFGGFPVENPTKKANRLKALLRGISLSEYGSEGLRVQLRRVSEYSSLAYLVERPTRETGRTVLGHRPKPARQKMTFKDSLDVAGLCKFGRGFGACLVLPFLVLLFFLGGGGKKAP